MSTLTAQSLINMKPPDSGLFVKFDAYCMPNHNRCHQTSCGYNLFRGKRIATPPSDAGPLRQRLNGTADREILALRQTRNRCHCLVANIGLPLNPRMHYYQKAVLGFTQILLVGFRDLD